jgi:hypothetical protein
MRLAGLLAAWILTASMLPNAAFATGVFGSIEAGYHRIVPVDDLFATVLDGRKGSPVLSVGWTRGGAKNHGQGTTAERGQLTSPNLRASDHAALSCGSATGGQALVRQHVTDHCCPRLLVGNRRFGCTWVPSISPA